VFDGGVHPDIVTTVAVPAEAASRDALLHRVRVLAAADHPALVAVTGAELRPDGALAVAREGGEAADLATVLAVRGRLTAPEAAGVLVAVAQALAALHSAGVAHGPVAPRDVVLDRHGRARLLPRLEPARADGADGFAEDVRSAARLVGEVLGADDGAREDRSDDDATALRSVLASALATDPRVRPEAGTLAAWAHDAVVPAPVCLPEPATLAAASLGGMRSAAPAEPAAAAGTSSDLHRRAFAGTTARRAVGRSSGDVRGESARRRAAGGRRLGGPGSGTLRAAGVVLAVVLGVGAATAVALQVDVPDRPALVADGPLVSESRAAAAGGDDSSTSAGDPTHDRADPAAAAAELTRRRVGLLASPDAGTDALTAVSIPGSAAFDADTALLERIAGEGTSTAGAAAVVHTTEVVERLSGDRADVVVTYALTAHEQRTAGATTTVPASGTRTARLTLVWTDDGWRVEAVS
jgi:hypothetical protein